MSFRRFYGYYAIVLVIYRLLKILLLTSLQNEVSVFPLFAYAPHKIR